MFERMSRGWELTKASFAVIWLDKEILLLPVMSFILLILVTASTLGGSVFLFGVGTVAGAVERAGAGGGQILTYALLLLYYIVTYFVIIFFNAAVIECASIRFQGGDPTVRDGLRRAWSRKLRILQWAVVAATVGLIIRVLRERAHGFADRLLLGGAGLAWNIATYFVVPVLVFQDVGPLDAVKRSAHDVRRTWGEALSGEISQGLVFVAAGILWTLLLVAVFFYVLPVTATGIAAFVVVLLLSVGFLATAKAAADGVLVAGLYRYAETGELPDAYAHVALPAPRGEAGS